MIFECKGLTYILTVSGRNILRASLFRHDIEVVAINHTCANVQDVIYLIQYDSTHGLLSKYGCDFEITPSNDGNLLVNGRKIFLTSERDLTKLNWSLYGADYIAECTSRFRSAEKAQAHVEHGLAKKVLISAPSSDAPTLVYRVNTEQYALEKDQNVVFSCASCTTNCLAPLVKTLDDEFGVSQAFMSTIHATTQSQHVLDGYSEKDRRPGRSAMVNIIPTTTGASKGIAKVLPHLGGKVAGISVRVPTTNVSMVDLVIQTSKPTTIDDILDTFRSAANHNMASVLEVEEGELVSCDFLGRSCSAVVDVHASSQLSPNVRDL